MVRLFKTNKIRRVEELDGLWDFYACGNNGQPVGNCYKIPVPSCWETHPDFTNYRGKAVFIKTVEISCPTDLRLAFKGVSHTADVFFDDKFIAHHYNAYTPFDTIITGVTAGIHEIKVIVDNSFGEHSSLHIANDYFTYGGIIRPVVMEYIPSAFIERIEFIPRTTGSLDSRLQQWRVEIKVFVKNISGKLRDLYVKGELNGVFLDFAIKSISDTDLFVGTFQFDNVKTWSETEPNLYLLDMKLYENGFTFDTPIDDLIERVGFRMITVNHKNILLNGKEIFLKGFNRHEDHPIFGAAIPFQVMTGDMALIKDLNANTIRTCHYPNDELFLDLCDESGIFVWEENHARGLSAERMKNPNFEQQCHDCIDEMIKSHFNHPSIIIWAVLNECSSFTEYGRSCYEKQIQQIRSMDTSRPVTYATCHQFKDICLDLADIVSWNLYYGWYKNADTRQAFDKLYEFTQNNGGLDKPVILSEFGAGAIYGYRDRRRVKWSEERQEDILNDNLSVYLNCEGIVGALIWQFCDCLVTEDEWFDKRPRTKNNKGIVDEYRRPKLAYDCVKSFFGDK